MSIFPPALSQEAASFLDSCRARGMTVATAESCTGGLLSALLTEIPGSSDVFTHGFVTYANAAKIGMLGVDAALIDTHGAVSGPVADSMAHGAQAIAKAGLAVAITGIAGPGGGTATKPVGLVYIAVASATQRQVLAHHFSGDRAAIRLAAVAAALKQLRQAVA